MSESSLHRRWDPGSGWLRAQTAHSMATPAAPRHPDALRTLAVAMGWRTWGLRLEEEGLRNGGGSLKRGACELGWYLWKGNWQKMGQGVLKTCGVFSHTRYWTRSSHRLDAKLGGFCFCPESWLFVATDILAEEAQDCSWRAPKPNTKRASWEGGDALCLIPVS